MNPFTPSPRDWPEDALVDTDNGAYMCRCVYCHQGFIGYKRRVVCKACHTADETKAKERGEWLAKHKAPADWAIVTIDELRGTQAEYANLLLRFHVEQNMRRKLAAVLRDQTILSALRYRDEVEALLAESAKLDEVKS